VNINEVGRQPIRLSYHPPQFACTIAPHFASSCQNEEVLICPTGKSVICV